MASSKKGLIVLIKNNYIKCAYVHRNADLDKMGGKVIKLIKELGIKGLNDLYDKLIEVDEDAPMTMEQKLAYKAYVPEQLWSENMTWTDALKYTKNAIQPLKDGFPYTVDYAGFLPSWRNRYVYCINLDDNTFLISRKGLEQIAQESDEFYKGVPYPEKMTATVLCKYPLDAIPENWMEEIQEFWKTLMLAHIPWDETAIVGNASESDKEGQHDPRRIGFYIGIKGLYQ